MPQWSQAHSICKILREQGHEALFAGGCVRDALLGRPAKDIDIATSATPDQVENLFDKTLPVGKAFGVILVVVDGQTFEVATFRTDGEYRDGRRPEAVQFSSAREDAFRRDFTVNAMFYDPLTEEVLDFVGGQADLKLKRIKTVGNPVTRFQEDALRLFRAVRFAAQLGFEIEESTWKALIRRIEDIRRVSRERITEEMQKLLLAPFSLTGLKLMEDSGLLNVLIPENKKPELQSLWRKGLKSFRLKNFEEDPVVVWSEFFLRWQAEAEFVFKASSSRFSFSKKLIRGIQFVLENHDRLLDPKERLGIKLHLLGSEFGLALLRVLELEFPGEECKALEALVSKLRALVNTEGDLPEPLVNGRDLLAFGMKKGPRMGSLLKEAYLLQLERKLFTRDQALQWLREAYTSNEA